MKASKEIKEFIDVGVAKGLFEKNGLWSNSWIIARNDNNDNFCFAYYDAANLLGFYSGYSDTISVEEFIKLCPPEAQEYFLFNLDLFR